MDESMLQTMMSFDLLHLSYMLIQTVLPRGKHGTALSIGIVPRLEDSKSTLGRLLCSSDVEHLFQSVGCARNKLQSLTVQQIHKIISLDAGLRLYGFSPLLIYGIWSLQFLETRLRTMIERWNPLFAVTQVTRKCNFEECSMFWIMLTLFPQTSNFRIKKLCCMCLKTTKQWSRWLKREEVPQWDKFPGPTELLLTGFFDRIKLDPKIQIKYIDTKNQLADILTKGNFTRDEWKHLLCLFNISHFSSTDCSEGMSKRTPEESGEERVTAKSKPMMNLVSRCSARAPDVLPSTASESPGESQTRKSNSSESANWEVRWNGETRCIRVLIKLLRMERW